MAAAIDNLLGLYQIYSGRIVFGVATGIFCGVIASNIAKEKGRNLTEGFLLGFFLSYMGLLIVALLPKNEETIENKKIFSGTGKMCPYCAEVIREEAIICRFCGKDVSNALPEEIICPSCGELLTLESKERIERKFVCACCEKQVDM